MKQTAGKKQGMYYKNTDAAELRRAVQLEFPLYLYKKSYYTNLLSL